MTNQQYQKCIDACLECATICNHCAVSCLEEKEVNNLTKCIRLDLECAVICRASAELLTLNSAYSAKICEMCAAICDACAGECEKHSAMEHCKDCAEACRACAKEALIIYQDSANKEADTINPVAYQEECAILSRAVAELISLGSSWSLKVSELNNIVCNASSEELERHFNFEMKLSKEYTAVASDIHQKLLDRDNEIKNGTLDETLNENQIVHQREDGKRKRRHVSALLAASMGRSAIDHVSPHVFTDVMGSSGLPNTGTVISYEKE